jgi:hypothetical protein
MPLGRYTVLGADGTPVGVEEFRCAPGPMGWRYFSEITTDEPEPHAEIVDLTVDAAWRLVRLRVAAGEHEIVLEPDGDHVRGRRDGDPLALAWSDAHHVDYLTPSANLVTCRRLQETADIDVLYLSPATLEPVQTRQRYELLGPEAIDTAMGRFEATRWRFTFLDETGWTSELWVAGDVVVAYEDLYVLEWYEPGATGARPEPAERSRND